MTQLGGADVTVTVLVEDAESFLQLLLRVTVLHLTGHHCQEFGEIDCSVTWEMYIVNECYN